jgi:ribosomal protein L29
MTDTKKSIYQLKLEAAKKRMEILTGKEKNLKAYKNLRREIAKMLTKATEEKIIEKLKK